MKQSILKQSMMLLATLFVTTGFSQSTEKTPIHGELKAVQFRIARPTNQLKEVTRFYADLLGMPILGRFENHQGYDGVMFGMPNKSHQLEFTQHIDKAPLPKPTKENLIVLYYDNDKDYQQALMRMHQANIGAVEPENPYWKGKSETFEDPDEWRVILFNGTYNP